MRFRSRRNVSVLFSTLSFSRGRFAAGLLILRVTFGVTVITHSMLPFGREQLTSGSVAASLTGILAGALLIIGLFTAFAALVVGGLCVSETCFLLPGTCLLSSGAACILTGAKALSFALLGPGAFSADAYLFGPREILIPPSTGRRAADADGSH